VKIGVVFPQTEIGTDPAVIRDYAQTAEGLGFSHILTYDHVVGANLASRPGWKPPYTHLDTFHEPFVLFSYFAGLTKAIEFTTGVIILPQRRRRDRL
jgi:alkanesulfonate monooxygenase SsuD/methylene tetrahydromethanopterin reductase-like flavin-dependent oxidoreductase (luciferase family)